MRNLADKYRPKRLADVFGQPQAVDTLTRYIDSGSNQTLLFVGPSGTGKTSLARILASIGQCTGPEKPCGDCQDCRDIRDGRGSLCAIEMDGSRFTEARYAQQMADVLAGGTISYASVFIDEVHGLQGPAADALLKVSEEPSFLAKLICATTDPAAVRPALRKRCLLIRFFPLSGAQLFKLLSHVCGKEDIRFEPKALDMIASASEGSARVALNNLDQVAAYGDVTCAQVSETFAFGASDVIVKFFDALLSGNLDAVDAVLYEWQEEPSVKARLIRDFLLYLFNFEVQVPRSSEIVNAAFYLITADERSRCVAGFAQRARAAGRPLSEYWLDMLEAWNFDHRMIADATSLSIRVRRFHQSVNPVGEDLPVVVAPAKAKASARVTRSRSAIAPVVDRRFKGLGPRKAYLDLKQVEMIYDCATFLPQHYDQLFNTVITIDHGLLGMGGEAEAGKLISDLTHELSMRVVDWAGALSPAHWLYVHERRDAGIYTRLVVHIPQAALGRMETWLTARMKSWRPGYEAQADALDIDTLLPGTAVGYINRRVARHWKLVKHLWRGIDPRIMHWNGNQGRLPLIDLLGLSSHETSAIGQLQSLRRIGSSRSLASAARNLAQVNRMGLLSGFADNAWPSLFTGWELNEYRERVRELAERAEAIERVELEWGLPENRIEADARSKALDALEKSWPEDPRERRRAWTGWWTE